MQGEQLFSLAYSPTEGYQMLDTAGLPALMTKPGAAPDSAVVEDRKGRHLTTLEKEEFVWDGTTYIWKPQATVALSGETTYAQALNSFPATVFSSVQRMGPKLRCTRLHGTWNGWLHNRA